VATKCPACQAAQLREYESLFHLLTKLRREGRSKRDRALQGSVPYSGPMRIAALRSDA